MMPYALITGASRGLGLGIAKKLAAAGYCLVLVGRNRHRLDTAVQSLAEPGKHMALDLDLQDPAGVESLVAHLLDHGILPEVVIHNLGGKVEHDNHPIDVATLRQSLALNLEPAVMINARLIPLMCERGSGKIIHVSSDAAINANASPGYAIAKAALNAYIVNLARHHVRDNILISGVLPGPLDHEGSDWDVKKRDNPEHYRNKVGQMPLGRFLDVDEVSDVVANLCNLTSVAMSGSLIKVSGAA